MGLVCRPTITNYFPASGMVNGLVSKYSAGYNNGSSEDQSWQACCSCSITKIVAKVAVAPGVGKSRRFTVRKNGVDTALTVTIYDTNTTGITSSTVAFATPLNSLDKISIKEELISGATDSAFSVGLVATTSDDRQVVVTGRRWGTFADGYNGGAFGTQIFNNNAVRLKCGSACGETDVIDGYSMYFSLLSSAGSFKNFRLLLDSIPCPSPSTNRVLARFEHDPVSGIIFNYIMQITTGIYTDSNNWSSGYSLAKSAGSLEGIGRNIYNTGVINNTKGWWTVDFYPSSAGHRIFNCDIRPVLNSVTTYHSGVGAAKGGDGGRVPDDLTNEPFSVIPTNGTIRNLYVNAFNAPKANKPLTITIRKNFVDTSLTLTITNPSTSGNNTSDTISVSAGDLISVAVITDDVSAWNTNRKPKIAWTFVATNPQETPIILTNLGKESSVNAPTDVCEDVHGSLGCINITAKVFTGLDHLEGQEVSIIADGEVLPSQTVASGQITLDKEYGNVIVGLPYASDLHTLREELQDDEGTIQGKKVKIGNVTVGFVESKSGFIGENEDSLYEAFTDYKVSQNEKDLEFESSSDVDEANLYTGDIRVPLGSRYRNGASLLFRQTKPLPVTISRLIKEIDVAESSQ